MLQDSAQIRRLFRAWGIVVAASLLSTALAALHLTAIWGAPLLIGLALIKARVILSDYLDLYRAPRYRTGFMVVIALWSAIALALIFAAG